MVMEIIKSELMFYSSNERTPILNQRVLIFTGDRREGWLSELRYTTAIYSFNANNGKNVFVVDVGGRLDSTSIIWAKLPTLTEFELNNLNSVLPF